MSAKMSLSPEDHVEITNLYARYNLASDAGDAEAYVACFTPDGVLLVRGQEYALMYKGLGITLRVLLKQHMGQVTVREDDVRYTIVQTPCGSGGRLRLGGAYEGPGSLPFVETPGPLTHGQDRFPVYCSHCPVWNVVAPVEWFGHPHWVFERPARPDGSCTLHVYKHRDGVPADYVAAFTPPRKPRAS